MLVVSKLLKTERYEMFSKDMQKQNSLVHATIDFFRKQINFKTYVSVSKFISANLNNFYNTNICSP